MERDEREAAIATAWMMASLLRRTLEGAGAYRVDASIEGETRELVMSAVYELGEQLDKAYRATP